MREVSEHHLTCLKPFVHRGFRPTTGGGEVFFVTMHKLRSKMQSLEKAKKDFAFCSLIRTFELCSKVLSLENKKKSKLSFGIFLAYSYLCHQKRDNPSLQSEYC